jgi:WhiB family redox-sensing transcriptional regulator
MTKIPNGMIADTSFEGTLALSLDLPGYFAEAACVGSNPGLFDGETIGAILEAKKVCSECPIKDLCLDWALLTQDSGVWGGLTPAERKKHSKGQRPVNIGAIRMLETNRARLLSNTPAATLAAEFQVTERTIFRWRKKIQATAQVS